MHYASQSPQVNILQFLFLTVGWLVAHEMWKFFNPNADTELNVSKLSDFVLSDQTGLENAGINMGYVSGDIKI